MGSTRHAARSCPHPGAATTEDHRRPLAADPVGLWSGGASLTEAGCHGLRSEAPGRVFPASSSFWGSGRPCACGRDLQPLPPGSRAPPFPVPPPFSSRTLVTGLSVHPGTPGCTPSKPSLSSAKPLSLIWAPVQVDADESPGGSIQPATGWGRCLLLSPLPREPGACAHSSGQRTPGWTHEGGGPSAWPGGGGHVAGGRQGARAGLHTLVTFLSQV